jgi:glycosyltransferase involved in cell wall biosynthesis
MMNALQFSIIVPTYNREAQLFKIISLLIPQAYVNWELIIVDDSVESLEEKVDGIGDNRILYFHRKEKSGVSSARNFGALNAHGQYLAFLDDDDQVSENWLLEFAGLITAENKPDVLFCAMQRVNAVNGQYNEVVYPSQRLLDGKKRGIVIPGAFIIRATVFNSIGGYDERILFGENTELFIRIRATNPKYAYTDSVNFYYFQSLDGLSQNLENKIESNEIVLQKHPDFFLKNKNTKRLFTQVTGVSLLRLKRFKEARHYLRQAFLLNPFRVRSVLRLIISYLPFLSKKIYLPK